MRATARRRQLEQPLERDLRRCDAEASGCLADHRTGQHRVVLAARPGERAERHERDAAREAIAEKGSSATVGEVEHVLHADDVGACHGVPQLLKADVAEADPGY